MFSINLARSKSKSISPAKSVGKFQTSKSANTLTAPTKTHLYDLPKIPSYYKIDRPSFSQQMKKNIEEKLSLDKTVQLAVKKREKSQDMFLKYNKNPFASPVVNFNMTAPTLERQVRKPKPQVSFRKKDRVYEDIVDAINSCREVGANIRDEGFKNIKGQASKMSQKFLKDVSRIEYVAKRPSHKTITTEIIQPELTLDAIVTIDDQNYYRKHQASINIFACLKSFPKMLDKKILAKYHFTYTSIIEKSDENIRFPIYRDLSERARRSSIKNRYKKQQILEFITANDVNTDAKVVRFEDLMGIASGRCTSQLVSDWVNNKTLDFSEELKNDLIIYKQNTKNLGLNYSELEQNMVEIQQWKMNDNPDEKRYAKKCRKINEYIDGKMKEKVKLTDRKMVDRNTHRVLTQEIKRQILYFLNMDARKREKEVIKVQGVKNSKLTSTKARTLKNDELITTMKSIKRQFGLLEQMGNKTTRL